MCDLCGAPQKPALDGRSLLPLLKKPDAAWNHHALSAYDIAEFSVRVERWRYARFIDDSEDLYDEAKDPHEWTNLAYDAKDRSIKERQAVAVARAAVSQQAGVLGVQGPDLVWSIGWTRT